MNSISELDFSSSAKIDFSGYYDKFSDSNDGILALEKLQKEKKKAQIILAIGLLSIIFGIFFTFMGVPFWINIILFIIGIILCKLSISTSEKADPVYQQDIVNYSEKIAKEVSDTRGNRKGNYFTYGQIGFVYWDDALIYFTVIDNEMLLYPKSDIKEVTRERVHVSSTSTAQTEGRSRDTFGTAVGINPMDSRKISATTTTNSVNLYQWHFSIMTDFIEHPNLNIVTPDNEYYENAIASAYSLLK